MHDIHQYLERKILLRHAQGAQHLETAEMRAQKDATLPGLNLAVQDFAVMNFHVKARELAFQQIQPIQYCRGETVEMPKHMPPASRATAYARQVIAGYPPGRLCTDQKVKCNRIQQQPRRQAPDAQRDPTHQPQHDRRAALRQRRPTARV